MRQLLQTEGGEGSYIMLLNEKHRKMGAVFSSVWPMTQSNHRPQYVSALIIAIISLSACANIPNPTFDDYNYNHPPFENGPAVDALHGINGELVW